MTDDKKVISTLEGTTNKIDLSRAVTNILENSPTNSISLNQTHTNRSGFSDADLILLCKYKSIKEFRLTVAGGKKYSANIGTGTRPKYDQFKKKTSEISLYLLNTPRYAKLKEISDKKRVAEKGDAELFKRFVRERNSATIKAFGWTIEENIKNADIE
jgi:hypothetical protein